MPLEPILALDVLSLDEEGRVAVVWLLGEAAPEPAAYTLRTLLEDYENQPGPVRLQLLGALAKLLLRRHPVAPLLTQLFKLALNDSNMDVQDRALFYYRLLSHDLEEAKRVLAPMKPGTSLQPGPSEHSNRFFEEFGTLSILISRPAETFIEPQFLLSPIPPLPAPTVATATAPARPAASPKTTPPSPSPQTQPASQPQPTKPAATQSTQAGGLRLRPATLSPAQFQNDWRILAGPNQATSFAIAKFPQITPEVLEAYLKRTGFGVVAVGTVNNTAKVYFYGQVLSSH